MSVIETRDNGNYGRFAAKRSPAAEADAATYGGEQPVKLNIPDRIAVTHVSIMDIVPDRTQPRQVAPSAVRDVWNGKAAGVQDALEVWFKIAESEAGRDLPMRALVMDDGAEWDAPIKPPPALDDLLALIGLAAVIRQDGLLHPISVARDNGAYRLETGERRWWAYHVLRLLDTDHPEKWLKIPAREMKKVDRWRQATENNARSQLNAIARARQLALLLMDLYGTEKFIAYDALVTGSNDRAFYAQVADGELWRVPRGTGERLVQAMGLRNANQLRDYRGLLRLPDDVWVIADDENWTEYRIRSFMAGDDTDSVEAVSDVPHDIPNDDDPPALPSQIEATVGDTREIISDKSGDVPRQLSLWGADARVLSRLATWTQSTITSGRRAELIKELDAAEAVIRRARVLLGEGE